MSATAFLLIRDALREHLAADADLAGVAVHVGRTRPIASHEMRAINVRILDSDPSGRMLGATDWRTVIQIECSARETADLDADTAADEQLGPVHRRLHTFAPEGLGFLGGDGDDASVAWDHDADETNFTCVSLRYVLIHRTRASSLQPWN